VLAALKKIDAAGFDLEAAKSMARQARAAVDAGHIGYAIVCAVRR
jgi:hypothetical protein